MAAVSVEYRKHLFPSFFSILDAIKLPEEINEMLGNSPEFEMLLSGRCFLLSAEKSNRLFLINPTIKLFLEAFRQPVTLRTVVKKFAKGANCSPEEISEAMKRFFVAMRQRGLLIMASDLAELTAYLTMEHEKCRLEVGQKIDQYQVTELVAKKSKVELYKVLDLENNEPVLMKLLVTKEGATPTAVERASAILRQEFRLMKELSGHDGICQFKEFQDHGVYRYGVMGFIEGVSLSKFGRANNPGLENKLKVMAQITEVMAWLHGKGIIHGDLHSSNFLIGEDLKVTLIDFDLSNHERPESDEITRNGGVFHYIPPERVQLNSFSFTAQKADFRSEIFQLGIVLYLALYDVFPFTGLTWQSLSSAILNKNPDFPESIGSGEIIPTGVVHLLKKALNKEPDHRFKDAGDMWLSFQRIFSGAKMNTSS